MWAVIVTNQGVPVQLLLVTKQDELDSAAHRLRKEWGCDHPNSVHVLRNPPSQGVPSMRTVKSWVDNQKDPKYTVSVQKVVVSSEPIPEMRRWKFCPECGCSWLHHMIGQSALEPEDWEPCLCSECGCDKAVNP